MVVKVQSVELATVHSTCVTKGAHRNMAQDLTLKGIPIGEKTSSSSWIQRERNFLLFLVAAFMLVGLTSGTPHIAMWVGFAFAGYSAIANDSIQTLGTFIASNAQRPWWHQWLFMGGIFLATILYSWAQYDGDVSYQRLASKGFATAPTEFHFLQLAAPIFLLILTRFKMPVSTTFLLLSCFAASGKSILAMTTKSLGGYGIAFIGSILIWYAFGPLMKRAFKGKAHPGWRIAQWCSTGTLWSVWMMQDMANIAVFLPRSLSGGQVTVFAGVIFLGLGVLFYKRGERIQEVVTEKADVTDVRSATIIDLVYAVILYIFKIKSQVPMSTTWVFIGLLGGRQLAWSLRALGPADRGTQLRTASKMVFKDLIYVSIGFIISLIIAALINPVVGEALFE